MRLNKVTFNNKTYTRVQKRTARKLYNEGKKIVICPCNLGPFNAWNIWTQIDGKNGNDFDTKINAYEYHNCTINKMGNFASFYVEMQ